MTPEKPQVGVPFEQPDTCADCCYRDYSYSLTSYYCKAPEVKGDEVFILTKDNIRKKRDYRCPLKIWESTD